MVWYTLLRRSRLPLYTLYSRLLCNYLSLQGHCCSACVANRPHHTTLASNERPLLPTHQKRNKKAERKWKKKLYLRSIAFTSFAEFPSGLWKFKQVSFLKFPVKIVEKCLMHFYNRTSERNRNFIFKGYQKFIFSSFLFWSLSINIIFVWDTRYYDSVTRDNPQILS